MAKKGRQRRKWWLLLLVAVLATVIILFSLLQVFFYGHMYPQDARHVDSNLVVKGVITSIEQNKVSRGFAVNSYHIYRYYLVIDITEIVWAGEFVAETWGFSYENKTLNSFGESITSVGYDGLDEPNLQVGQTIECKGYYVPVTDTPYSFKLTIAPSINGSYLKIL